MVSAPIERPASTVTEAPPKAARLFFVDNIRVFLTILVILHHLVVIYAGTGSWLYNEGRQDMLTEGLGGWFCAVNQAYFMGLFLLISAYFVPGSYDRKGPWRFLKDRLVRLGIPLVVYAWVIRPLFLWAAYTLRGELSESLWQFYRARYFDYEWIGGGPLWFIETLLIFSLVYALWRLVVGPRQALPPKASAFPSRGAIALFALLVGVVSFAIRQRFSVGYAYQRLNLQFPFFAQYIAMFIVGLIAYRRNWLLGLPEAEGKFWLRCTIVLILLFPVLAFAGGIMESDEPFGGGPHWQAFAYATWEQFLCVAMSITLIYLFRRYWDRQGQVAGWASRNAYTAYLIHEPVITSLAWLAAGVAMYPMLKIAVAAVVMVPLTFALSALIRKIPGTEKVL